MLSFRYRSMSGVDIMTRSNSEQLEEEYLNARREYCMAMMAVHDKTRALLSETPIDGSMKQAIIKSSGVKIRPNETQDEFDERFEDEMGLTINDYVDFALDVLERKLEPTKQSIVAAANKELGSLTSGPSGSAWEDFQHTIHEGAEYKTIEVSKCLPESEHCILAFNQAKLAFRDAATNLIHAEPEEPEEPNHGPRF
ncbi:TPA: hypothetical protein JAN90_04560 [Legionella pneumophila]|nr:lpg0967 family Dot/Icm T4SS effector [Legionella pneumophila]HAT8867874.1 hypothetical protein [Legionella pneumophila subsp. pneumophila]HAT7072047.1 hypothetical protein [Legionella pneumophila]HAT8642008.1 hypothetical protein [Legionella pneumophila]HAT8890017.1 hypothetical protein [Legionella pneumophila subsp. pneumophila]HAT8932322.1 hypothetical protein [Legionella pneumophila subsp. pneumophila]